VVVLGTTALPIEAPFKGTIFAPNTLVRLASVTHTGSFIGKQVELGAGVSHNLFGTAFGLALGFGYHIGSFFLGAGQNVVGFFAGVSQHAGYFGLGFAQGFLGLFCLFNAGLDLFAACINRLNKHRIDKLAQNSHQNQEGNALRNKQLPVDTKRL
jgi:hypothetical protein